MFNDDSILAYIEFNEAYKYYTDVCNKASKVSTVKERKTIDEDLKKASRRFNEAYNRFKAVEQHD